MSLAEPPNLTQARDYNRLAQDVQQKGDARSCGTPTSCPASLPESYETGGTDLSGSACRLFFPPPPRRSALSDSCRTVLTRPITTSVRVYDGFGVHQGVVGHLKD